MLILNLYRNYVFPEEIHQDAFNEGLWDRTKKMNADLSIYGGRFYPVSEESISFDLNLITYFDGRPYDKDIEMDVFLN